jgi:hypothetical protein
MAAVAITEFKSPELAFHLIFEPQCSLCAGGKKLKFCAGSTLPQNLKAFLRNICVLPKSLIGFSIKIHYFSTL